MVTDNTSARQTAFTVSIEAAHGVTTGISAHDRAHTIKTAIRQGALPNELSRPGHIFPLRARDGGVLVRPGHTEASVDLARLAGFSPSGVICEVMKDDGTMARRPDLVRFARKHQLTLLAIADLITYRLSHERLVRRIGETTISKPPYGEFTAYAYSTDVDSAVHLALVMGDVSGKKPVLTRVHRATALADLVDNMTGDGSLKRAFDQIKKEKRGVIVLLQKHLGGLDALARKAPSNEKSVVDGQSRLKEVGLGAQILQDLGVEKLRLLTNTPNQIIGVERYGIEVVEQIRLGVG
jgi:3,4-dihydroxy 2-butanone 4-phosphate synthase/GTP cyclohydrolase II